MSKQLFDVFVLACLIHAVVTLLSIAILTFTFFRSDDPNRKHAFIDAHPHSIRAPRDPHNVGGTTRCVCPKVEAPLSEAILHLFQIDGMRLRGLARPLLVPTLPIVSASDGVVSVPFNTAKAYGRKEEFDVSPYTSPSGANRRDPGALEIPVGNLMDLDTVTIGHGNWAQHGVGASSSNPAAGPPSGYGDGQGTRSRSSSTESEKERKKAERDKNQEHD